jgi:hypothetical protein
MANISKILKFTVFKDPYLEVAWKMVRSIWTLESDNTCPALWDMNDIQVHILFV